MKYFLDTEFIENGKTIDLISIGIVSDDGREFYAQNEDCEFLRAGDWVWRNVFPHLKHFDMRGRRDCKQQHETYDSGLGHRYETKCKALDGECPWCKKEEISRYVLDFCSIEKYGKPEFWGYFAAYDWVAFCQLFGPMIALPKGYPMYCRDIKQWCKALGDPRLPEQGKSEHSAIGDARWNRAAWEFLNSLPRP